MKVDFLGVLQKRRGCRLVLVMVTITMLVTRSLKILYETWDRSPVLGSVQNTTDSGPGNRKCVARKEGVVVLNTLGRLANNLFEVAYANQVADELCWDLLVRPMWGSELPSERGSFCLPNARLPNDISDFPRLSRSLQALVNLNATRWSTIAPHNTLYTEWIEELGPALVHTVRHQHSETRIDIREILQTVETSQVRVLDLQAFFISYDWIKPRVEGIRHHLKFHDSCCHHSPQKEAVVLHYRDLGAEGFEIIEPSVYVDILRQYNLTGRSLWIVCQPSSLGSHFLRELLVLVQKSFDNVTIVPGHDPYDAFCALTRASTLLLSYRSSYSAMAALLSNATVHNPITQLRQPAVTLNVPGWKYHLLEEMKEESGNSSFVAVKEFDVSREKIDFRLVS